VINTNGLFGLLPRQVGLLAGFATLLLAASACRSISSGSKDNQVESWTYPIRLGDSRAKAHQLLGNPNRKTDVLEEFPLSGVTLWFDSESRISKVGLQGIASSLYVGPSSIGDNWIPSDRALLFGLNARSTDEEFSRILGTPVERTEAGRATELEVRQVWRRDGYMIDATFLAVARTKEEKTFPKGTLLWFSASRGL
jgi:hypothetical protein